MNNQSHLSVFGFSFGFLVLVVIAFVVLFVVPQSTLAETKCVFTRDLDVGTVGEDVRCLQKYLNEMGFTVSNSGVGSPGFETNQFKELTKEAVKKWQISQGISPATGYFGILSRTKHGTSSSGTETSGTSSNSAQSGGQVPNASVALTNLLSGGVAKMMDAYKVIKDIKTELDGAWNEIDDAEDDGEDISDAEDTLESAEEVLGDAKSAFFDGEFDEAKSYATEIHNLIRDALGEIDDKSRGLTFAEAIKFNNETVIKVEYKGDKYVIVTSETSKGAIIDEIMDEIDDDDLDESDVKDELVIDGDDRDSNTSDKKFESDDEDDANDALDDAKDLIDNAWEDIEEADDDGEDVSEAEDLMDEAEDLLNDAEGAFDDEDYDEVIELTNDIEDLVDEALDSI